jgi:hypothetical protein
MQCYNFSDLALIPLNAAGVSEMKLTELNLANCHLVGNSVLFDRTLIELAG